MSATQVVTQNSQYMPDHRYNGWRLYLAGAPSNSYYPYAPAHQGAKTTPSYTRSQNGGYPYADPQNHASAAQRRLSRDFSMSQDSYGYQSRSSYTSSAETFETYTDFTETPPDSPGDYAPRAPLNFPVPLPPSSQADTEDTMVADEMDRQYSDEPIAHYDPSAPRVAYVYYPSSSRTHVAGPRVRTDSLLRTASQSRRTSMSGSSPPLHDFPTMQAVQPPVMTRTPSRDDGIPRSVPVRRSSLDEPATRPGTIVPSRSSSAPPIPPSMPPQPHNVLRKPPPPMLSDPRIPGGPRPQPHRLLSDTAVTVNQQAVMIAQRPDPRRSTSDPLPMSAAHAGHMHAAGRVRWKEDLICPSPVWPSQRRQGWWNRRGDQLWTNDGGYRGPSPGLEYPLDLADYPDYGEGWQNEEGRRIDMQHRLIQKMPTRPALKRRL